MPPNENPFLDWTASLFKVARRQCLILTNSRSLYSVLAPGRSAANSKTFAEHVLRELCAYMILDGTEYLYNNKWISPSTGSIKFCRTNDRRLLGSMNDLIRCAKWNLLNRGFPPPLVDAKMNKMPMSKIDFKSSKEAFLTLADQSMK